MKDLHFKIYIGSKMYSSQGEEIIAVIDMPPIIPKGQYNQKGELQLEGVVGFKMLSNLADYINDWIDLAENESLIKATIYLHKISKHRVFRGKQIVKVIDAMAKINNYNTVEDFDLIKEII